MAKARKFGAFAGVFVPSILTILGVIMYLRLGWVIGEAGLLMAIGVILISHIISVSTGLSVSSIATDKKVKAGGLYYILSRSLGLPIGGAIGITLFVGTALSIALYVVGFSESVLDYFELASGFSVTENTLNTLESKKYVKEIISGLSSIEDKLYFNETQFLQALDQALGKGLATGEVKRDILAYSHAVTVNDLRFTGTITVITVTTIAFISTSFALKTQFFIFGAIILSLVSIFMGSREFAPETVNLFQPSDGESLSKIFGIFFPAVTGFTAGVAMSGDLKDPKQNIPIGTMSAIVVGLVVYLGLAVFMAYTIDSTSLRSNNNILKEIAFGSHWLVLIGIWGATLSSALGGILGAPRILQAISVDRITPKLFGKGAGKSNEPRNALILTFIIAEIGILIGELDTIAGVVSMFYLTAYGFINFSCFLESWASSDFRPQFRIPRLISVTGFVSVVIVMAALDIAAMLISFVIIGMIFLYLVRKQISLEGAGDGDIWEGVWTSVVRRGLNYIVRKETQQRNWRPNIILFSGGAEARPYLLTFGRSLIGKLGFLSDFYLVERNENSLSFSKPQQLVPQNGESSIGFFNRRQECNDIYEGMENIARTYGFSGVDPNTVLLGWGRETREPLKLISAIQTMITLDYNILMLHHSSQYGFGNRELIDIWWRNGDHSISLTLKFIQFMQKSEDWRKSEVRFLLFSEQGVSLNQVYKHVSRELEEMRVDAEIKMIQARAGAQSFNEAVRLESKDTDLIVLGMSDLETGKEETFLQNRTYLTAHIEKSILLVKPSSYFSKKAGDFDLKVQRELAPGLSLEHLYIPSVQLPEKGELAEWVTLLKDNLEQMIITYNEQYLKSSHEVRKRALEAFKDLYISSYATLEESFGEEGIELESLIHQIHASFLTRSKELLKQFIKNDLLEEKDKFAEGSHWIFEQFEQMLTESPKKIKVKYDKSYFEENEEKTARIRYFKLTDRIRFRFYRKSIIHYFRFHKLVSIYLKVSVQNVLQELFHNFGKGNIEFSHQLQKLFNVVDKHFYLLKTDLKKQEKAESTRELFQQQKKETLGILKELERSNDYWYSKNNQELLFSAHRNLQELSQHFEQLTVNYFVRKNKKKLKSVKKQRLAILEAPDLWLHNQKLVSNVTLIEVKSLLFQYHLKKLIQQLVEELNTVIDENILKLLNALSTYLNNFNVEAIQYSKPIEFKMVYVSENETLFETIIDKYLNKIKILVKELPDDVEMITEESMLTLDNNQSEELEATTISLNRLFDYLIQIHFIPTLLDHVKSVPRKFQKANNAVQDVNRLLAGNISKYKSITTEEKESFKQEMGRLFKEENQQIARERQEIKAIQNQLSETIEEALENTLIKFTPYIITKSAKNLDQYIRKKGSKKALSRFGRVKDRIRKNAEDFVSRLWYHRNVENLAIHPVSEVSLADSRIETLLNLVESVSPKKEVLQKLPVYYQQLFTQKQNIGNDFWFGREKELKQAEKIIQRFKDRLGGGLMIVGEYNSGRTFLAQYITEKFFYPQYTYSIDPPQEGSIDPQHFKKVLEYTLEIEGSYENIFDDLALNTVLIFNDIELWWERSENGLAVIDILMDLIDRYGDQCLFILHTNVHAFRLINHIRKIEDSCLGIIECGAVDTEVLKEIILFRHKSSPITFRLSNTIESEMNDWKYARLISRYFDYSQGNVGVALQSWISNIEKVEEDEIIVREPLKPNLSPLKNLPNDWMIMLIQFILHKHMTLEKLERIILEPREEVEKHLRSIKRTGLIREIENNVFELDKFIEPHLISEFIKMELI